MNLSDIVQAWIDPIAYIKSKNATNINILVGGRIIGTVQSVHIKTQPNNLVTITANRARFDTIRIVDAFDKGLINGCTQKLPLSIKIEDSKNTTTIDDAWVTNNSYTYHTNNYDIVDSMIFETDRVKSEKVPYIKDRNFVIQRCKFCETDITIYPMTGEFISGPNKCNKCQKYGFCLLPNGTIESEIVNIGNFFLIYISSVHEANVVSVDNLKERKIINTFSCSELTHESVIQWADKLKTYVIFQ